MTEAPCTIPLTQGKVAVIDAADYPLVAGYRWRAASDCHMWYAITTTKGARGERQTLRMHRLILGAQPGELIDHIDGDGLNNRRSNLRTATDSQNSFNRKVVAGISRYKGVIRQEGRWVAHIRHNGVDTYLGSYPTEIDAALAYDLAAIRYRGEFASTNLLIKPPDACRCEMDCVCGKRGRGKPDAGKEK